MRDEDKTKEQLISELNKMHQQITELEKGKAEHKKAEEALLRSEERYRVLAESLFDTVYQFDLEGRFVYANEAATHIFGYSIDEILNSIRVNDTIDEKDILASTRDIDKILKGGIVVGERTFIRKDGTRFVGEIHSGPVYEGKKIVGVRGILRDLTERKQIEHDLNERVKELGCLYNIASIVERPGTTLNELYQEVTNLLPASWQYPEISCARIIINDKEFRTKNYAETQWKLASTIKVREIDQGVLEVNYLEARPEIGEGPFSKEERHLIDAVAERLGRITERMLAEEALAKAKDELEVQVKERTAELVKVNENLSQEMIERKRAHEALEAAHAFQQSILDGVAEPIMVIGVDYRVKLMNRAAREFSSGLTDTLKPLLCYQISHQRETPCDGMKHPCPLEKVRESGRPVTVVHEYYQANGEQRFFEVIASPLLGGDGTFQGIIESKRDITKRMRAEETLQQYTERLRALAAQLAELTETERQQLAQELHDQVGQNLTALGINLNIVQTQLPKDATDLLRLRLNDSLSLVEQTAEQIRDVMANLRPPVLDDYGLVSALRWYGEQFATRTAIAITVEGEEPVPRLDAQVENALFRIAQEALANAAKHAKARQITVTIDVHNGTLRMVVADDGVGFEPERLPTPGVNQGWGLIIMRERAEAVGGVFSIESRPGSGTRLIVEVTR